MLNLNSNYTMTDSTFSPGSILSDTDSFMNESPNESISEFLNIPKLSMYREEIFDIETKFNLS